MVIENEIIKYLGIATGAMALIVSLHKLFKFLISRSIDKIDSRLEFIEKGFFSYKENNEEDVKEMKRRIAAIFERMQKDNNELIEKIAYIEGYNEAKKERKK